MQTEGQSYRLESVFPTYLPRQMFWAIRVRLREAFNRFSYFLIPSGI